MGSRLSIAVLGLMVFCISHGWAGTTGNGSAAPATTQYAFCYAGNVNVVYFTQILTLAPTANAPNLGVAYADYVKTTYGLPGIDRQRCVTSDSSAGAAAEKQRYKGMFGTTKLVETKWGG
jgi:hypothetical protein